MTPQHARAVARLPSHWRRFLRTYYRTPSGVCLSYALHLQGIGFLDIVLMLARRRGTSVPLGILIGKPVTVGPRVRLRYPVNGVPRRGRESRSHCWRVQRVVYLEPSFTRRYAPLLRGVRLTTPLALHMRGVPWRTLDRMRLAGCLRTEP